MSDSKKKYLIVCLLLAAVTFGVYWSVARNEFIALDDPTYVSDNPDVKVGLTMDSVRWAFTTASSSNWHPLTWLSHILDCQLFGLNAGAHHLESVGIHIVDSLLLLFFLTKVTKALWRSAFVAALFALHPAHVESVAWVSERKDVLSTFFFMLTLLAYAKYVEWRGKSGEGRPEGPRVKGRGRSTLYALRYYVLALFLFAWGLMSKPMLVSLPFLLLLVDYWPLRRWPGSRIEGRGGNTEHRMRNTEYNTWTLLLEKLPFFALSAASCAITVWAQGRAHAIATFEKLPMWSRVVNSLVSYLAYIEKMFWPAKLAVFYPFPLEMHYGPAFLAVVVLLSVSALAVLWRYSRPYLLMGWLWYLGTLVPVIGILQVGSQSMADRYTYIPSIGLSIAVIWLIADLEARFIARTANRGRESLAQGLLAGCGLAVLVGYAVVTYFQVRTWRNNRTLFEQAISATDRNFMAYTAIGGLLNQEVKPEAAIEYFKTAIQFGPHYPSAWFGMGNALYSIGKHREGEECLKKALEINPEDTDAMHSYAIMLMKEKKFEQAERLLRRALELRPKYPEGHLRLAILLQQQGSWDEAVTHYQAAIRFKPEDPKMDVGYAEALFKRKQYDMAMAYYRSALRINPELTEAKLGVAGIILEKGDFDEAAAHFSAILISTPTNAAALDGLGYTLAMRNKPDEAFPYFVKATAISPTNGFAQLHLAMELERKGESAQAVEHYRLAVEYGQDHALAMNNLAWILATHPSPTIRNGGEAVQMAERACQIAQESEPFFMGTLAAAYAEAGRFEEAIEAAQKARDLAQTIGMKEVVNRNTGLLELYRSRKPYHEQPRVKRQ